MTTQKTIACLALMAALAGSASATAEPLPKDAWELTLSGQGNFHSDFKYLSVGVSAGFMLTRNHEAGVLLQYSRFSNGSSSGGGSLGAFYHYNFRGARSWVPFLGGGAGFGFGDDGSTAGGRVSLSDPSAFLEAGGKFFINDGAEVRVEYVAERFFGDDDVTFHGVILGIALVF